MCVSLVVMRASEILRFFGSDESQRNSALDSCPQRGAILGYVSSYMKVLANALQYVVSALDSCPQRGAILG
ncbi:hypothetical protein ACP4OV_016762 [Aristida adscensionis]